DDKRNKSVVQDIWSKVFGVSIPDGLQILCGDDRIDARKNRELHPKYADELWYSDYKKDVTKVGPLHNTILVDDDKTLVLKGQECNFLKAPGEKFLSLKNMHEYYQGKSSYAETVKKRLVRGSSEILAFYKFLYIAGVLDCAAQHEAGIIAGLYAIQFKN